MSRKPRDGEGHVAARIARSLAGFFGVALALFSITMVTFAAGSLLTGEDPETERSTLMGLVVLFTGSTFWGLHIAKANFGWRFPSLRLPSRTSAGPEDKRQRVLAYATSGGGRVTAVEVAGRCHLTIEESQAILNDFAAREVAELLVADDGTVVYDFNILSDKEKARAKDLT